MQLFSDLHIHSKYSRACSKEISIRTLAQGAKWKGINLLGTGDFTHPLWLKEIEENLIEFKQGSGLYIFSEIPEVLFVLSSEVNFIFQREQKTKRVHFVVLTENIEKAKEINKFLSFYGNLEADGRPTLTLDPKNFLKNALEIDPEIILIPAHIWTPWFGILGSFSGFDSIEECFEELTNEILAVETGLSSDPLMNWQVEFLDKFAIVSFSDSHSSLPHRLGREATVFNLQELSFKGIRDALKNKKIDFTIEFFPEEGKYHYDGHRNCGVSFSPEESEKINNICPVCQRPLTIGVLHRVKKLGNRDPNKAPKKIPFFRLVPLSEIIAKTFGTSEWSNKVKDIYFSLVESFGTEYSILLDVPLNELQKVAPQKLVLAIEKVRKSDLKIIPGYDGEYGKIEFRFDDGQKSLFGL